MKRLAWTGLPMGVAHKGASPSMKRRLLWVRPVRDDTKRGALMCILCELR